MQFKIERWFKQSWFIMKFWSVFKDLSKPYVQFERVIGSDPVKIYQIQPLLLLIFDQQLKKVKYFQPYN